MDKLQNFQDWWSTSGEWVEEPNQRRGGESGVQILHPQQPNQPVLYSKRQVGHSFRSLRYPCARPTVLREKLAIEALSALGIKVPTLVFYGAEKKHGTWHAILVTEELKGFICLDDWYAQGMPEQVGVSVQQQMLHKVAQMLACMHRAGWQHSCCYAKHIFIAFNPDTNEVQTALLDLEKTRRRWPARGAAKHDMEQLKRRRGQMPLADWQILFSHYCQQNPALTEQDIS